MATSTASRSPHAEPAAADATTSAGRGDNRPGLLDNAAYWIAIASIYVLQGALWFHSGKSKVFDDDGNAPPPIKEQFDGTFFETIPTIDGAWLILGVMQLAIFVVLVASAVTGEFLMTRRKPLLLSALALAMLCFSFLLFGDIWTNEFEGAASLYAYFGATAVIFLFVLLMPPYRKAQWLSGLTER